MKKMLCIFALVLVMPNSAFASFSDVPPEHRYYDAIEWARELKVPAPTPTPPSLIEGYSDGTFRPDAEINRAEFLKIVIDANGKNLGGYAGISLATIFPDVDPGVWYASHLKSAKVLGIINGYPDGTFRPANPINVAEAAKIIVRTQEEGEIRLHPGEEWFFPYTEYLQDHNALPDDIIHFGKNLTRGEMVYMMYKLRK